MGKAYSEAYRNEALKLREEMGREATAQRLKISVNTIDSWKKKAGVEKKAERAEKSTKVASENRELHEKIKEMEKEIARIKKENEFLEDAARFFAQSRQK